MDMDKHKLHGMLDELFSMWARMHGAASHKAACQDHSDEIVAAFIESDSANEVLRKLRHIDGVGLTIATGILWASDPGRYVPFDKRTTGLCLREKWIRSDAIVSADYEKTCARVVAAAVGEGKRFRSIQELVVGADDIEDWLMCSPR